MFTDAPMIDMVTIRAFTFFFAGSTATRTIPIIWKQPKMTNTGIGDESLTIDYSQVEKNIYRTEDFPVKNCSPTICSRESEDNEGIILGNEVG